MTIIRTDRQSEMRESRYGREVSHIVIHSPEQQRPGTVENTLDYLKRNIRKASYHELLYRNIAYKMVPENMTAWHAGSKTSTLPSGFWGYEVNYRSYGISLWNYAGERPDDETIQTGVERTARAMKFFGRGIDRVVSHGEIDPTRRNDPEGVDMNDFRARSLSYYSAHYSGGSPPATTTERLSLDDENFIAARAREVAFGSAAVGTALYDSIVADGLYPNSPERWGAAISGTMVAFRHAETWDGARRFVYYILVPSDGGAWGEVYRKEIV